MLKLQKWFTHFILTNNRKQFAVTTHSCPLLVYIMLYWSPVYLMLYMLACVYIYTYIICMFICIYMHMHYDYGSAWQPQICQWSHFHHKNAVLWQVSNTNLFFHKFVETSLYQLQLSASHERVQLGVSAAGQQTSHLCYLTYICWWSSSVLVTQGQDCLREKQNHNQNSPPENSRSPYTDPYNIPLFL